MRIGHASCARKVVVLAGFVLAAGCADGESGRGGVVERDSAGITIVEVRGPVWGEGEDWTVGAEPEVRIGVVEGDPNETFDNIRGVFRLSDGRIVVGDGTSREIRFFSPAGEFEMKVGGGGGGPGEFTLLWWVARGRADSILAWDWRTRRMAVFAPDGSAGRVVDLSDRVFDAPVAFADGILLLRRDFVQPPAGAGVMRAAVTYLRYGEATSRLDSLATVMGWELEVVSYESPTSYVTGEIPYSRAAHAAVSADRLYVGANDRFEIEEHALDGSLVRIIRYPSADREITDADAAQLEAEVLEHLDPSPGVRANIERAFREVPRPPLRPAFSDLLTDRGGNLWVADWVSGYAPPDHAPARWYVFSPDGRLLGGVDMPTGFWPRDIGRDYVLGVSRDGVGVERVALYRLSRR